MDGSGFYHPSHIRRVYGLETPKSVLRSISTAPIEQEDSFKGAIDILRYHFLALLRPCMLSIISASYFTLPSPYLTGHFRDDMKHFPYKIP